MTFNIGDLVKYSHFNEKWEIITIKKNNVVIRLQDSSKFETLEVSLKYIEKIQ